MFVECPCGARNSAFNPLCVSCGTPVVEDRSPSTESFAVPASAGFREGAVVGRFTLERSLGSGGLGRVFVATSPEGERVALKVLHPHLLSSAEARARFVREARALRDVRHRHIGSLLDALEHEGFPVLVLELVEGTSLRDVLERRGPLPEPMARAVLTQLADALHAVHGAGWIHRDVKPENVMIVSDDPSAAEAKLLDFGLARALGPSSAGDARTAAGAFIGSVAYAAPEQVLGGDVGPAVDWWALGVVAYELLTGSRPFPGERRRSVIANILAASPPPMAGVTPALESAVRSLLVADPTRRPGYEAVREGWQAT